MNESYRIDFVFYLKTQLLFPFILNPCLNNKHKSYQKSLFGLQKHTHKKR